ncbi:MAG: uridine monophosphate kinase [Candidatus Eisenbacteria bacterium]|nr:uridine monophosphate kinase [Candidatus Eisenbacteria bacterium]
MTERDPRAGARRVMLKLSGEMLGGASGTGLDEQGIARAADHIAGAKAAGYEVAVVLGGGNIARGAGAQSADDRVRADGIGMLATLVNALAVRAAVERRGLEARVACAFAVPALADIHRPEEGRVHLEAGRVLFLAGGTGNPYFSTDTAAALRALELGCSLLIKGTKVDGVFERDPRVDPAARRFDCLPFSEVLRLRLGVMDLTAITLCMENRLPVVVLNASVPGSVRQFLEGASIGTRIVAEDR